MVKQAAAQERQVLALGDVDKGDVGPVARQVRRVGLELLEGEVDQRLGAGGLRAADGTASDQRDYCRPAWGGGGREGGCGGGGHEGGDGGGGHRCGRRGVGGGLQTGGCGF